MSTTSSPAGGPLAFTTRTADETRALAGALAPVLVPGDVLVLAGDMGSGKTTFVQGLAAGLGIVERVNSPTYILMKEYLGGRFPLLHMDVYRISNIQEVIDLGYDEFLDPSYVVVVEWGDMVEPLLPQAHLKIEMINKGGDSRTITFSGTGRGWKGRLATMSEAAEEILASSRNADHRTFASDYEPGDPSGTENN